MELILEQVVQLQGKRVKLNQSCENSMAITEFLSRCSAKNVFFYVTACCSDLSANWVLT